MIKKAGLFLYLSFMSGCFTSVTKDIEPFPNLAVEPVVEVNRLPHPFNLNGSLPYAVWVDGEMLPLKSEEANKIVESLNLKFEQPPDTEEIHSGRGWLYPYNSNKKNDISNWP